MRNLRLRSHCFRLRPLPSPRRNRRSRCSSGSSGHRRRCSRPLFRTHAGHLRRPYRNAGLRHGTPCIGVEDNACSCRCTKRHLVVLDDLELAVCVFRCEGHVCGELREVGVHADFDSAAYGWHAEGGVEDGDVGEAGGGDGYAGVDADAEDGGEDDVGVGDGDGEEFELAAVAKSRKLVCILE